MKPVREKEERPMLPLTDSEVAKLKRGMPIR